MKKEFRFVCSGYNENNKAMRLYDFVNKKIELKDTDVLNKPSYVTSYQNYVFTYTKDPLDMLAYKVENDQFVRLDRIIMNLESMTHLTYSEKNHCLYGASYLDGCICKIDFQNDRFSNLKIVNHKELYGENSKCHAIITNEDETQVLCVNIATDTLYIYDVSLKLIKTIKLNEGCGPRHAIWRGNLVYVVTEYSNELYVVDIEKGILQIEKTIHSKVKSYGATLFYQNGKIYVSNRGEETIAIFDVLKDGLVKYKKSYKVFGEHSRHMIYHDGIIITCNKNSNEIVFIDIKNGHKITKLEYPNPSGICIIK